MARDLTCSLGLLCVAAIYYGLASGIGRSALADEVGPTGLPVAYAVMLAGIGLALGAKVLFRTLLLRARRGPPETGAGGVAFKLRRASGALAIGIGYIVIVPFLGYLVALSLVIATMLVYQGERPTPRVAAIAVLGAAAFWLLFDRVLGIPMPGFWDP
jgi:hypothetical protein